MNVLTKCGMVSCGFFPQLFLAGLIMVACFTVPSFPSDVAADQTITKIALRGEPIIQSSLVVADFDQDGDLEIVAGGSDGMLYVVAFDGIRWSVVWSRQMADDLNAAGPPKPSPLSDVRSAPAIADLDNDGRLEIVVSTGGDPVNHRNGGILVYSYKSPWSFSVKQGWPQPRIDELGDPPRSGSPDGYWDGIWSSPALGDLDGDGDLEVVVITFNKRIFAWHHTGKAVDSWPIYRGNGDHLLRGGWSSPALGDIDGDDLPEVVVGTNSPPWEGDGGPSPDYTKATLWAINGDSTNVPGFPVETEQWIQSSPALGDIDGDGELEIVVGTGVGIAGTGGYKVYAWNGDGSPVPHWPRPTAGNVFASPALGDLDGDRDLEIVVGCGLGGDASCTLLYAWHGDGSNVKGFPMEPEDIEPYTPDRPNTLPYAPVLADYDGDGQVEILVTVETSYGVTVVEADGTLGEKSRLASTNLSMSPLVADVDNDGRFEMVVAAGNNAFTNGEIDIWDEAGSINDALPWPMFHRDVLRTGQYPLGPRLGFPNEFRFLHQQGTGKTVTQYATLHNLGNGEFDWEITNPVAGLRVTPASGTVAKQTVVELTMDVTRYAANIWHNLGNLTVSGRVDGEHVLSSPRTVPVWLYTGDLNSVYLPLVLSDP